MAREPATLMLFPSNDADGSNWLVSPNLELVCRVGGGRIEGFERGSQSVPAGLWPAFLSDRGQLFLSSPRGLAVASDLHSPTRALEEVAWPGNFTVNKIQFRDDGSQLLVESLDAAGGSSLWRLIGGRLTPVLSLPKGEPFLWHASPSLQWLAGYRRGSRELVVWQTDTRDTLHRVALPSPLLQFWIGEGDNLLVQNLHGDWEMRTFAGQVVGPLLLSPEAAVRGGQRHSVLFYQADASGGGGYYRLDLSRSPRLLNCAILGLEGLVKIASTGQARCFKGSLAHDLSLQDEPDVSLSRLFEAGRWGQLRVSTYFQPMAEMSGCWLPIAPQRLSPSGLARQVGNFIPVGASAGRIQIEGKSYTVKVEQLPRFGYLFQPQTSDPGIVVEDTAPYTLSDLLRVVLRHGGKQLCLAPEQFPQASLESGWVAVGDKRLSQNAIARLLEGFSGQIEGVSFRITSQGVDYLLVRDSIT